MKTILIGCMALAVTACSGSTATKAGTTNAAGASNLTAANEAATAPRPTPSATPAPRDLATLLGFDKPARCEPGKTLSGLITKMEEATSRGDYHFVDAPVTPPGYDAPVTVAAKQISKDDNGSWEFGLPLDGQWLGLHVTRLIHYSYFGGESTGLKIRFSDPQAQVAAALRKAGFVLSKASKNDDTARDLGLTADGDAEEYADSYLTPDGDGVLFTCDNYFEV